MEINKSVLHKVAHLSRLELPAHKEEELIKDLEKIVSWVEKLKEVNTENVEPLTNMSFEKNVLRKDISKNEFDEKQAFENAPDHSDGFFQVPKVLDSSK